MNLHIFNDEKFFDPFVNKLEELNLLENNKFVVKTNSELKYIKRTDLVTARLYNNGVKVQTNDFDKVFLHSFARDLYPWVLKNEFKELNWMIWGSDLYDIKFLNYNLLEPQTLVLKKKVKVLRSFISKYFEGLENFVLKRNMDKVFKKITNVLTWIPPEYDYAINNLKGLDAKHQYFMYGFDLDIEKLSDLLNKSKVSTSLEALRCVVGNSGAFTNNHLDAIEKVKDAGFFEILVPLSYGNFEYVKLLKDCIKKKHLNLNINYMDNFMDFTEYIKILNGYDVFITNSTRPLGMGNIWIALLTGKLVFMNKKNFIYDYLNELGLKIFDINEINNVKTIIKNFNPETNISIVKEFASDIKIQKLYKKLFSG